MKAILFVFGSMSLIILSGLGINIPGWLMFTVITYDIMWIVRNEYMNEREQRRQRAKIREIRENQIKKMWIDEYVDFRNSRVIDVKSYEAD